MELVKEGLWRKGKNYYVARKCKHCDESFLGRKDRKTNIFCTPVCRQSDIEQRNTFDLCEEDIDIITGSLLSDGCITKSKGNRNYYFTHTSKDEDYVDFLASNLSFRIRKSRTKTKYFELRTGASPTFTKLRKEWYGRKKKIPNIRLNPTVVLHWYLGDGTLDNRKGAILCTDNFARSGVVKLISMLRTIGIQSFVDKVRNRIIIPNRQVYEFLQYIGLSPVSSMVHKWDSIVKESYFGRVCLGCCGKFDTLVNHKRCCSDKCYRKWYNMEK